MGIPPASCPHCDKDEPTTPEDVGNPKWCHCPRKDMCDLYERICPEALEQKEE